MSLQHAPSLQQQLQQEFAELTPALQAAARHLLEHPADVVVKSMRALATDADTPPATLLRLARRIGFTNWPALKAAAAAELGLAGLAYGERAQGLLPRGRMPSLVAELFSTQRKNLELTQPHCEASLLQAAACLARARAVHVAGFRASFPIAYTLAYLYRLLRNSVHLLDGLAGGLEMNLRALQPRDALVVISFAPYSIEAMTAIRAAHEAGCAIVALTDSNASPLALAAEHTLLFSARSPSFFPSISAGIATAEALVEMLVARAGAAGVARIERSEAQLRRGGAYVDATNTTPRARPRRAAAPAQQPAGKARPRA